MTSSNNSDEKELKKFEFTFEKVQGGVERIPLQEGNIVFVLGANGTEKSGLMQKIYTQNRNTARRISAHRQTWFSSNTLDFTPANKMQTETSILNSDASQDSRWRDQHHGQRAQIIIFNLINAQNERARKIADAVDDKKSPLKDRMALAEKLSETEAPLKTLNHLLHLANLPIKVTVIADERILASKKGCPPYSIAELSDGERNAILIAADVLTAKENTLFVIDEPERHLHRSIISPLLSALFQKRPDCAFIIATHDVTLPLDNPDASVLLVRDCIWNGKTISGWDTDLVSAKDDIDYHIKQDILGSRRTLLFVEGTPSSLDHHIYQILFPTISVIPQGSCSEVERVVLGISEIGTLHWVRALGLIDADDRQPEQITNLLSKNIFALPCYSVESLYYKKEIMQSIANKQAKILGGDGQSLMSKASKEAIQAITEHKNRLCARLCERKIRNQIPLPNWEEILRSQCFETSFDVKDKLEEEKKKFDSYIRSEDIDSLIGRYPVRETPALDKIAKALEFQSRKKYESAVLKLLIDDEAICEGIRKYLGSLTTAIEQT